MKFRPPKVLSVTALAMISVAAIVNLRNLPILATQGAGTLILCILAAIVFLIPTALVCAELASSWPEAGGVYLWAQKAFGSKVGLFTIWSEWINNVIGFPATLSFIAATILYIFIPHMQQHKILLLVSMLVIIWGCTVFNFLGIKASSRFNIFGAIFGSIIPGIIIIIMGIIWLAVGKPMQIQFNTQHLVPHIHIKNVVFFLGILYSYAGMQITAFHAPNVKHPRKDFPRAIAIAVILILGVTIFASLAIAMVVPKQNLSLVTGVIQGFNGFFAAFHLEWALPVLAFLITISGLSSLSAWILGPARGLAVAAKEGYFPRWFSYESEKGSPTRILVLQAIIASCLSLLFLFTNSFSTAFWLLMVLTSQFTMVMYIIIFGSALRLRYKAHASATAFRIPGGNIGLWIVAGISMVVCAGAIVLGYFPPASLKIHDLRQYDEFLIIANLVYIVLPFVIYRITKNSR